MRRHTTSDERLLQNVSFTHGKRYVFQIVKGRDVERDHLQQRTLAAIITARRAAFALRLASDFFFVQALEL